MLTITLLSFNTNEPFIDQTVMLDFPWKEGGGWTLPKKTNSEGRVTFSFVKGPCRARLYINGMLAHDGLLEPAGVLYFEKGVFCPPTMPYWLKRFATNPEEASGAEGANVQDDAPAETSGPNDQGIPNRSHLDRAYRA